MHSDRFDRREMLRIGSLAIGGLTLPQMFAARAATTSPRRDTSVIRLYRTADRRTSKRMTSDRFRRMSPASTSVNIHSDGGIVINGPNGEA